MNPPIKLSEINIVPVKPRDGLIGFCTFVIDEKFYIGSVAIFSRLNGDLRLVYPQKNGIDCCHPLSRQVGEYITDVITQKFLKFNEPRYENFKNSEN